MGGIGLVIEGVDAEDVRSLVGKERGGLFCQGGQMGQDTGEIGWIVQTRVGRRVEW